MVTIIALDADTSPRTISPEDESITRLAATAARGDEAAFAELYGILSQRVFNLVLRSVRDRGTAEDLCQEIWLKVHKEMGCLRTPEAFRSWVYRIASHACIDFARSPRATRACTEELTEELAHARETAPEDAAIRDSQVRMVWESLATIAPRQGIALYLKQVDGRSYDEIAAILECSHETVESLLFRARQSFAKAYQRVESSHVERCQLFHQMVARVIDNEPTQLQRSAIKAHLQDCRPCRTQLPEMAAAAKGYSLLPLLPANVVAWQAVAAGGVLVAPATTGGIVAGLSLKAKLAGLISFLALSAGGAATTGVVNVPLIPDTVSPFHDAAPHPDQDSPSTAAGSGKAAGEQALGGDLNAVLPLPTAPSTGTGPGVLGGPSGRSPTGLDSPGARPSPQPPASPASDAPDTGGPPGPDVELPEDPTGTLLGGPIGTLDDLTGGAVGSALQTLDGVLESVDETLDGLAQTVDGVLDETVDEVTEVLDGLTGGAVGDTLDALLPPSGDEGSGPVGGLVDGVDETLDGLLPGEDEDAGLVGGLLNPLLPPQSTPPPANTPAPQPTPRPCLLGILC